MDNNPQAPSPSNFGNTAPIGHPYRPPPPTSGLAITSLVFGLLGFVICVTGIPGAIMGHIAMGKIKRSNGQLGGSGLALAGVITGWLSSLLLAIPFFAILAAILVPAVTKVASDAKITEMKANGKNIYTSVYADAIDANVIGFPALDKYASSTDYFKALAGESPERTKIIFATPDFVASPYSKMAYSWAQLRADNVGWAVVAGFDESTDAGLPFLISDNISATSLHQLQGPIAFSLDPSHRMGSRKVVVAPHGGGAMILSGDEMWEDYFIATDYPDHPILHP